MKIQKMEGMQHLTDRSASEEAEYVQDYDLLMTQTQCWHDCDSHHKAAGTLKLLLIKL